MSILGLALSYIGIISSTPYILVIGFLILFISIYGLSIIKFKELHYGEQIITVNRGKTIGYDTLVSVIEVKMNFLQKFIWAVRENKFYKSPAWQIAKLEYLENGVTIIFYFMIAPDKKKEYERFKEFCKNKNPRVVIVQNEN